MAHSKITKSQLAATITVIIQSSTHTTDNFSAIGQLEKVLGTATVQTNELYHFIHLTALGPRTYIISLKSQCLHLYYLLHMLVRRIKTAIVKMFSMLNVKIFSTIESNFRQ